MSSGQIITELNSTFTNPEVLITYPYITLQPNNNDSLPVVLELMEEGDIPILFERDGVTYELRRVDKSPLNLCKLLRIYPFSIVFENKRVEVTTTQELMEVYKWMH